MKPTNKIILFLLAGFFLLGGAKAYGDFTPVKLSLTPAKYEITLEPGESKNVLLSVTNSSDEKVKATLSVENFLPSDDQEEVVRFTSERDVYSGRELISLQKQILELNPREEVKVPVRISVPSSLPHSGRFAVVFVTFVGENSLQGGSTNVQSRLGSLFFIRVGHDFNESGELTKFGLVNDKKILWNGPINFYTTFKNDGNVHLNPYGEIAVENIFGGESTTEIKPWFTLPGSTRTKTIENESVGWKVGKFKGVVKLNRGYDDVIDERQIYFWVVSLKSLAVGGGLVIAAALGYRLKKSRA
ncbi:MAG TPA: hypothetical protein VJJ24_02530 [Candidatus Paceibacterota bacterium]